MVEATSAGPLSGLIILSSSGRPILQTHFRTPSPSYPSIYIDALNSALARSSSDVPPILWVAHAPPDGAALAHLEKGGLRFLCPISREVDPLFALAFLRTFVGVLENYLGQVSEGTIKDSFDVVYQLLEEMLDDGYPLTTEPNTLRDIVLPPSLLNKVLSVAGVSGLANATPTPFASPIPWRRPAVKHANNEIFFDVTEEIDAILDRTGCVISTETWGTVSCNSRLSGTPDLLLTFTNPAALEDPQFHPCIRHQRFARDKLLSFIPPDGRFELMRYRVGPPSTSASSSAPRITPAAPGKHPLPFAVKSSMSIASNQGRFEISISSRLPGRALESVRIEIYLGKGALSASAATTGLPPRREVDGAGGGGGYVFDPSTKILKWDIPYLPHSAVPSLSGTFTSSDPHPRPSRAFSVHFTIPQHTQSGIRVEQLKVAGDAQYRPFKGFRGLVRAGRVECRW